MSFGVGGYSKQRWRRTKMFVQGSYLLTCAKASAAKGRARMRERMIMDY